MEPKIAKTIKTRQGDTVGLLLYLHMNRDDDAAEQALYDINPGLAKYGTNLPSGLDVNIPIFRHQPCGKW